MSDEDQPEGGPTRRPDPTLGRKLSSRPQLRPIRSGTRGVHRRRAEKDDSPNDRDDPSVPERTRVVLADPKQRPSSMRPRVELEQSSTWGTGMVGDLARRQLRAAVGVGAVVALSLGALPLLYFLLPTFASLTVFGVPVAWLSLGVLPFPLLFGAGMCYSHIADRNESTFVEMFDG